jgi:hypothetical protein
MIKNLVGIFRAIVRDYNFLKKPPKHLPESVDSFAIVKRPLGFDLWQQVCCSFDGTGNKQREKKSQKGRKWENDIRVKSASYICL